MIQRRTSVLPMKSIISLQWLQKADLQLRYNWKSIHSKHEWVEAIKSQTLKKRGIQRSFCWSTAILIPGYINCFWAQAETLFCLDGGILLGDGETVKKSWWYPKAKLKSNQKNDDIEGIKTHPISFSRLL